MDRAKTMSADGSRWRVGQEPLDDGVRAHTGDRWIAASAVAFDLPLASDDKIFDAVEGLELLPRVAPGP